MAFERTKEHPNLKKLTTKKKQLIVRVEEDFYTELKLFCVKNNTSIQDFVLNAIQEKFKNE
ncbi:hypothetical protein GVX76_10800 [[Haemophilus] felis]|nr:hypothetical protein [[Haemophilus] felis]